MLQREVADRLTAAPGTREYGVLTVLIGHSAKVRRLMALPPGAFRPPPKVHSAVVRLEFHAPDPAARDAATVRRAGAGDLHAAPENARERAQGLSSQRDASPGGRSEDSGP